MVGLYTICTYTQWKLAKMVTHGSKIGGCDREVAALKHVLSLPLGA